MVDCQQILNTATTAGCMEHSCFSTTLNMMFDPALSHEDGQADEAILPILSVNSVLWIWKDTVKCVLYCLNNFTLLACDKNLGFWAKKINI
jgi:hypothetical protein